MSEAYIVNEDGSVVIPYTDERIQNFGCMHVDKMMELAEILTKARMPNKDKSNALTIIDKFNEVVNTQR